jgi:DNA-binding transcriptional regulator YhcF (GntR family)
MAHRPDFPRFELDRDSGLQLGTQLGWRLRTLIASGRLAEGERLPAVREMAGLAGVNVNTVRSVYARLADEGAIVSEHGRGTFVADRGAAERGLDRVKAALGGEPVGRAEPVGAEPAGRAEPVGAEPAGRAEPRGGTESRVGTGTAGQTESRVGTRPAGRAEEALRASAPSPRSRTTAAADARRRASLRAEIALLERELAALEPGNGAGQAGGQAGAEPARAPRPVPKLLTAAELERTRDDLIARLQPLRADRTVVRGEREQERLGPTSDPHRQRAIATSKPRFETGPGGWSLRWRG